MYIKYLYSTLPALYCNIQRHINDAFKHPVLRGSLAAFEQVVHDTEEAEQEYAADDVADVIVRLLLYQKIFG